MSCYLMIADYSGLSLLRFKNKYQHHSMICLHLRTPNHPQSDHLSIESWFIATIGFGDPPGKLNNQWKGAMTPLPAASCAAPAQKYPAKPAVPRPGVPSPIQKTMERSWKIQIHWLTTGKDLTIIHTSSWSIFWSMEWYLWHRIVHCLFIGGFWWCWVYQSSQ